jgi:hypothetical protein
MSSAPMPGPSDHKKFANPPDVIPIVKKTHGVRKFFATRRAILAGKQLYLCAQQEIRDRGLMGPWAFDAAKSIVAAAPGILMSLIFLSRTDPLAALAIAISGVDPLQDRIEGWLSPLMGSLTL